jgi:orotate phosphoribosyltransferase
MATLDWTSGHSSYATQHARLLELMRALSFERRQVTLSSGKTSDFYVDSKQSVLSAEGHFLVGQLCFSLIQDKAPTARAIGGLTMGADPIASAIATVSFIAGRPLNAFYVRKEPKGHGTQQWIEGQKLVPPGTPVVIVEDVITTGASTLRAIERARAAKLEVLHVLALVDRQEEDGLAAVRRETEVTSLFTRADFLEK